MTAPKIPAATKRAAHARAGWEAWSELAGIISAATPEELYTACRFPATTDIRLWYMLRGVARSVVDEEFDRLTDLEKEIAWEAGNQAEQLAVARDPDHNYTVENAWQAGRALMVRGLLHASDSDRLRLAVTVLMAPWDRIVGVHHNPVYLAEILDVPTPTDPTGRAA